MVLGKRSGRRRRGLKETESAMRVRRVVVVVVVIRVTGGVVVVTEERGTGV